VVNSFLFIIPAIPKKFSDIHRVGLQDLCISHLISQTYSKWEVLWISENAPNTSDKRFIHIDYEGPKEEKLQVATKYIIDNNISADYIIRLDDDDLFNTKILNEIKGATFDVTVDKHQSFWMYGTNYFASRVWYWFPNTCIHKKEHALAIYGVLANGDVKQLNSKVRLIENDHSKIHRYYIGKQIRFSLKNNPIYLRTITSNSVTYNNSNDKESYYSKFGNWKQKSFDQFNIPHSLKKPPFNQSINQKLNNSKNDFIANVKYQKIVFE